MTFPSIIPAKTRRHHTRKQSTSIPVPPDVLALVTAAIVIVEGQLCVRLTFNQAIDASGFNAGGLTLVDGAGTHAEYVGSELFEQPTPASIIVAVEETGPTESESSTLSVSQPTGLFAVDGGDEWAGVENFPV